MVRNQYHVNPAEFENNLMKQINVQKFKKVLAFSALPTSFEKAILTKGSVLKDEEKQALENYMLELKANNFALAFSDAVNAKHKSTIKMEI